MNAEKNDSSTAGAVPFDPNEQPVSQPSVAQMLERVARDLAGSGDPKRAQDIYTIIAAAEWQPIKTAPQNVEVLIAVFRDDFEDPIVQNSILLDGEEKGLYWSDWHGMPAPTHWMPLSRPRAALSNPKA